MINELNKVIEYIENNLTNDISLENIAKHICVSDYHLRTVFYYLSGMTMSEYIKNRRLAEANQELLSGTKVTDVAFKYRYQSIDGFTRAFKKWSGCLPSEVISQNLSKSFPELSFVITVKGGNSMEYRIEEKPEFYFAGVSRRVPMQFEGVNNAIVELAKSITKEQRNEMHRIQNMEPCQIVNASYEAEYGFMKDEGDLMHLIGVLTTEENISNQLDKVPVQACTWAVFPCKGVFPKTMQDTTANVYSQWLPGSEYEVVNIPSFSFTVMDKQKKDFAYSEIWVPVHKK